MGNVIYKLQDGLDLNKLKEAGFDLVPGSEKIDEVEGEGVLVGGVFVKVVPQAEAQTVQRLPYVRCPVQQHHAPSSSQCQ